MCYFVTTVGCTVHSLHETEDGRNFTLHNTYYFAFLINHSFLIGASHNENARRRRRRINLYVQR
jgi:hypothetical protein